MDKQRAGVLSFYYDNKNFGGQLQAYAMQKILDNMGLDAKQIQFQCYTEKNWRQTRKSYIKKRIKDIIRFPLYHAFECRKAAFLRFQRLIPHTERIYQPDDIKESCDQFDAFVCGGDQIWNEWNGMMPGAAGRFALDFVPEGKTKLSYSASTGSAAFSPAHIENLRYGLQHLDAISVREKSSVRLIEEISGKAVVPVLDPALLLTAEQWDKVIQDVNLEMKNRYSVCYLLGVGKEERKAAMAYLKRIGCKAHVFPHVVHNDLTKATLISDTFFGDVRDYTSGPAEFVYLIKHSDCVITDSFHAIVFSLIYHKDFYVFKRETKVGTGTMNVRIYDFLEEFGLQSRLITPEELMQKEKIEHVDYSYADSVLARRRNESMEYLKNALGIMDNEKQ